MLEKEISEKVSKYKLAKTKAECAHPSCSNMKEIAKTIDDPTSWLDAKYCNFHFLQRITKITNSA